MNKRNFLLAAPMLVTVGAGEPPQSLAGTYLCTTEQRAFLASDHREGADRPRARADESLSTTFKLQIVADRVDTKRLRALELPYAGPDRDQAEWQDEKSVLHDIYFGTGDVFRPVNSPAFLTLDAERSGALQFYHAGFELPGGEDTQLAIRWGRCKKAR